MREFTRLANKLVDSRHIVRLMILSSAQDSPEALGLNVFSGRLFLPNNLLGVAFTECKSGSDARKHVIFV